ncbi:MAG: GIY-YIG nuclease family protein [Candidatus Cyclobacteriaceae bacterium M2_1C_046]
MFSVYILYSSKIKRFYIGFSSDVDARIAYHNSDKNKIWTSRGKPWDKFHIIPDLTEKQAVGIERHTKKMKSRKYLENLKKYSEITERLKMKYC